MGAPNSGGKTDVLTGAEHTGVSSSMRSNRKHTAKKNWLAKSMADFLEQVSKIRRDIFDFDEDDPWDPWFRGHQRAEWELVPKIYRKEFGSFTRISYKVEPEAREEFAVRGGLMSSFKPAEESANWDWYFLMQHFKAPTRLLDWTEGSLIALYFAVKDNPGYYDATVWMLDPYELNEPSFRPSIQGNNVYAPNSSVTPIGLKQELKRWLPDLNRGLDKLPANPIAIYPAQTHQRMSAQRSCFTIHGRNINGLKKYEDGDKHILEKIVIPGESVLKIKGELKRCGMDEATIFPDLEGLGECVSRRWLEQKHCWPHQDVYTRLRPSVVHKGGVGVFALKDIKAGTELFPDDSDDMYWIAKNSLEIEEKQICKLYDDFAVFKRDRQLYGCPTSFNRLTVSWYLNHPADGGQPNVRCDKRTYSFFTIRPVKEGEELTVEYETYSDSVPPLKPV